MKHVLIKNFATLAAALLGAVILSGCSGGAGTTQNPITQGPESSNGLPYNGPPPATPDIQSFRINFWEKARPANRCGNCHQAGGQAPTFTRSDDVNLAYQQSTAVVDREVPSQSRVVTKVAGGHNCWLPDPNACASILTRWITDWVGATAGGGRSIQLVAPAPKDPGSSRRFPAMPPAAYNGVHNLLTTFCDNCHRSNAPVPQSPYFASADINESYLAALAKINLDSPAQSRLVVRLRNESHNCWPNTSGNGKTDCANSADVMQAAIQALADSIPTTQVDPTLVLSKALKLTDGTLASGGNRYESNMIALYEFKTGQGTTAFDTSGVDPSADLQISGSDVTWFGGYGLNFRNGKAQASTTASRKFHQLITATGEFSIEAWVVPGNVTQEDTRIVSYSGSTAVRNFTLGQTQYSYDFLARSSATGANGAPALSTDDGDRRLQSSLQHVVMTFDPINGRRIYVNGEFTGDVDPTGGGTLGEWDNSFAFVIGNEVSNNRQWAGVMRLLAIHNRSLTLQQIQQNFTAGVGEKFFLLFGVEHLVSMPKSYVLFEVTQFDSFGYLFNNPKFISLDASATPGSIPLKGMRIGVNGVEAAVGQAYRLLNTTVLDAAYTAADGQSLSRVGTVIGREQGPDFDEFFLCFDQLGTRTNVCSTYANAIAPTPVNSARPSDIGVRTFDQINAAMAAVTGISPNNARVKPTFTSIRQSLPAVADIQAFLSSHQTSIAQLAVQYCAALIDDTSARATYFPGFNFGSSLSSGDRALLFNPLIDRVVGSAASQPSQADVTTRLNTLVDALCTTSACGGARTVVVAKAVCAATVGSAATLIE
jgi:hypothetical protein